MPDTRIKALSRGVWGVVATPFTDCGDIDEASLARLVEFYESVGAAGLTVLGVFGEADALTTTEKRHVLKVVAEHSRLSIVAGITSLATAPAIMEVENAQASLGDRLQAVMVQVNSGSPVAVIEHLQRIHQVTGAAIVLQDYPKSSGVSITTEDLIAVLRSCPFISAVKAEAPPTSVAIARITAQVELSVFGGLGGQGLLDELAAGSAGAMTGFSYPEALVRCVNAWLSADPETARVELLPYLPLINFEQQPGIALAIRKELFFRRGLFTSARVRTPAKHFPKELDVIAADHLTEVDATEVH
ncbi:dihydrodipicolinate synthase family protein [Glutamicibacter sp. MNS18]|uniref:dihydrodipicolinate synthase family protein n=1 Tax=Glutamicibacter sp. MNS18 TaxID=2989817 RepID=UPI0022355395|nr:dihydrodipicolinate synthase family protein [Glutamicibacter sp. MNS18]MCW4466737.1 dihydrodipicolinate synthase family protein [Glutamicibacter sp. MNS18]